MHKLIKDISITSHADIIKFTVDFPVKPPASFEFHAVEEAQTSMLALQLLQVQGIRSVFITPGFIAVKKTPSETWENLQKTVTGILSDFLDSGRSVVLTQKIPVSVYAESTTNPATMKFVTNRKLIDDSVSFEAIYLSVHSPFARALYDFPNVKEVSIEQNSVLISLNEEGDWFELSLEIREFIRNYIAEGREIIS